MNAHQAGVDEIPQGVDAALHARGRRIVKVSTMMLPRWSWQSGRELKTVMAVAICTSSKSPLTGASKIAADDADHHQHRRQAGAGRPARQGG